MTLFGLTIETLDGAVFVVAPPDTWQDLPTYLGWLAGKDVYVQKPASHNGREGLRSRSRPALRPHLLRARVLASYVRLLPTMVRRRREMGRRAVLSRRDLERWLVRER